MTSEDSEHGSERQQTDESLRVEREKADLALGEELAAIDETADAVISRARARADEVLAAARARTDRRLATTPGPPGAEAAEIIHGERAREDEMLSAERAGADETLREERAHHAALLSRERGDTDSDLAAERACADHTLAARDEFMGIVGHDLRNMLNAIVGFAELIVTGVSRENHAEQVRRDAMRIQRSAARMNRLVGDLVDIASIDAGRLAVTREIGDPAQVVMEAVETFLPQAGAGQVSLVAEIQSSGALSAFDPARILQVLTNLLSNAIKFTPLDGKVIVRLERRGPDLRIAVSDTGAGIPTDQLEAVFERFVQVTSNDPRGMGLGLYISKAIVEGHGGRIWAENRIGGGSTFCFTLPVHVPA